MFNDCLFSNTTITFSRYKFLTKVNEAHSFEKNTPVEEFSFTYSSGIKDFAGKIDFDYIPSTNNYIKFGTNIIRHTFNPGVTAYYVSGINGSTENADTTFGNKKIMADEFSAYIEDDLKISNRFKANLGLHFSGFMVENKFYNSLQFRFSDRFDAGLTLVYGTGNAITLPTEKYAGLFRTYSDYYCPVEYYESRNSFRMASYHRLDISANFHKQKKWGIRTWRIGVYNAYSRQNPFFLYFDTVSEHGGPKEVLKQVSLFPIIPSISFSFEF